MEGEHYIIKLHEVLHSCKWCRENAEWGGFMHVHVRMCEVFDSMPPKMRS